MAGDPNHHHDLSRRRGTTAGHRAGALLALTALLGGGLVVTAPVEAQQPDQARQLGSDTAAGTTTDDSVAEELVVIYEPDARAADRAAARSQADVERVRSLGDTQLELVRPDGERSVEQTLDALRGAPGVLAADPNLIFQAAGIPDDPLFDQLWGLRNTGQEIRGAGPVAAVDDADIDAELAWDRTVGSPSVTVAVLDSGHQFDHPDLGPVTWTNPGEVPDNGVDDDGNGYVDDVRGWDFVDADNDPDRDLERCPVGFTGAACTRLPPDTWNHGVHVAGTIGAKGGDGIGISGTGQDLRIMPLRVCPTKLGCRMSAIIEGVIYAGNNGAKVANLSLGGIDMVAPRTLVEALAAHPDTLYVAAAGNSALEMLPEDGADQFYPCAIDPSVPETSPFVAPRDRYVPPPGAVDNVLCVAATDRADALAGFSNFGRESVDLAAPGVDVLSTSFVTDQVYEGGVSGPWTDTWTTPVPPASDPGQGFLPFESTERFLVSDPPPAGLGLPRTHERGVTRATRSPAITVGPEYSECRAQFTTFTGSGGDDELRWSILVDGQPISERVEESGSDWIWPRVLDSGRITLPATTTARSVQLQVAFTRGASGVDEAAVAFNDVKLECTRYHDLLSGTSMATPHVAGVAGLLFSMKPTATVTEVREAILAGVDPLPSLAGRTVTGGRLNAWGALEALVPMDTRIVTGPTGSSGATATFTFDSNGSGPAGFECSLDGAPHEPCTSPVTYDDLTDGPRTFSVRSALPGGVDRTPATRTWTVDATAPVAEPSLPPEPASGWYTDDVTVTWNWTDGDGAGIDPARCTTTSTFPGDGLINLAASCTDLAGNFGFAQTSFRVDTTAPTLAPTVTPDPVRLGGTATATPGATDTGSGIAESSCATPTTATLGRSSVTCAATDVAGNTATATATYTVGVGIRWAARPTSIWPDAGLRTAVAVQLSDARGRPVSSTIARRLPACAVRFQLADQRPVCATYVAFTNTFVALVPTTSRLTVGTTINLTATATLNDTTLGTATTPVRVIRR